jgi:uncharacterized protein
MRTFALGAFLAAALALIGAAPSAEVPIPPAPTTWITDNAGFLTATTHDSLDRQLADYSHSTGHQVIVWIGTTTGAAPLEDWTIRAFTAWKVGRKGLDDGLALFIFTRDHKVRIEVGYGLEGVVTDAVASRIEHEIIVPRLKAGDADGAVSGGVQALLAAIGGEQGAQTAQPAEIGSAYGGLWVLVWLFIAIMFIVLVARSPAFAGWTAYTIGSGRRYAGSSGWGGYSGGGFSSGGFGGGGFSGGGGMGGGGGASASW